MRPQPTTSRLRLALVVAVFSALLAWIFADVIFHDGIFAFRDAGHFYYPLFQFIQTEWAAGRVPLWNPLENQGTPLLGNAACSVLYPGKIIFFLPISFAWAYRLYVLGHVTLAAFWSYRLARHWHASIEAAGISALSYAFCGNVLMQHANVIFLVGAAWLPAAMLATDNMLVHRKIRHAAALGVVLALMTLGGDPQMAYNTGLLAALYAFLIWQANRVAQVLEPGRPQDARGQRRRFWKTFLSCRFAARVQEPVLPAAQRHVKNNFTLLATAAAVALLLSAVQIIPSMQFTKTSDRAATETARSIYEIPTAADRDNPGRRITDGLLCRGLTPATHHGRAYQFSVGPWRMAEFIWPNFSGRQYPTNRRWLEAVPAEGRLWVPSLYMGIIPLLLGISAMRLRGDNPSQRWLTWSALLAVLASFGWYGLGWLVEEFMLATGNADGTQIIGQPVGGLYWLMTVILPGYIYFRYPAKLLIIAAIALSTLAARGWDEVFSTKPLAGFAIRRWFGYLCLLSLLASIVSLAIRPWWHSWLSGTDPDVLFGPLDTHGAANDLLFSFLQTAIVCAIAWALLKWVAQVLEPGPRSGKRPLKNPNKLPNLLRPADPQIQEPELPIKTSTKTRHWTPLAMFLLIALDLAIANAWMVASAPQELWQTPSKIAQAIRLDRTIRGQSGPIRVWRHPIWLPPEWQTMSSPDRMAESVRWDRDTLWPKHNLAEDITIVEVHGTMINQKYLAKLKAAAWPEIMDITGAEYAILPANKSLPGGRRIACGVPNASLWYREVKPRPQQIPPITAR